MDAANPGFPYASPTIRILGPLSIDGPGLHPRRHLAGVSELIVYLALHPHGVDLDALALDLWRHADVPTTNVNSVVSRARCWLRGPGRRHDDILTVRAGHVTLAEGVAFDWRHFDALARRTYGRGHEAQADLREALDLVRGPVLHGRPANRYAWLVDTDFEYEIPATVVDVANHLATICLETGDWAGARDAARTGLQADPYAETLMRARLRAECALGNYAQARAVARTLLRDGDDLEPETVSLLEELPIGLRYRVGCVPAH